MKLKIVCLKVFFNHTSQIICVTRRPSYINIQSTHAVYNVCILHLIERESIQRVWVQIEGRIGVSTFLYYIKGFRAYTESLLAYSDPVHRRPSTHTQTHTPYTHAHIHTQTHISTFPIGIRITTYSG